MAKAYERILVGLKTLDHVEELMDLACRMSGPGATLRLLHVIELPDPTPLDASVPDVEQLGTGILEKAKALARQKGMEATAELLRAREASSALLDEVERHRIDLAVLGYHHRRTLGEILLGCTAQHVTKAAPCRILLSIPPRNAKYE